MKKISYTSWWASRKKSSDVRQTLSQMDLYNKTEYHKSNNIDNELLEKAAKYAHENGLIYFVTVFEEEKPFCYLEINKGFYRVCFLDGLLRKYMSYDFTDSFKEINPNKLFLNKLTIWEFKGSSDKMIKITDHVFKADGSFVMIERDLLTNEQVNSEAKNKIDVTSNWEDYPEFGKYDSLIRVERLE